MALSRSFVLSIGGTIAGVLLEVLLFLPGSPTGAYLEATLGVSSATIITLLIAAIGIVLLIPSIIVIAMTVIRWRRTFHAELVGKDRFLLGETVHFRAWFKGELKNGLFTCKVQLPDGTQEWWPAYDTFRREKNRDFGVLSGRAVHEAEWSGPILKDYPTGRYTAHIKVCDRADLDSDDITVKEKPVSFWVLPPGYASGSGGTSAILTSSGDAGFATQGTEAVNAEKLRVLSPIHMMIMTIERVSPRAASFGPSAGNGIGCFVRYDTPNLNLDKVRSVFSEYAHVLGDHHLKEWLKFSEEIRQYADRGGFWVGKREWKWFDELEREYREMINASLTQTTPEIAVKLPTPQPELAIPISELKSTGEVKELEVRFRNGEIRKNRVCFYYVTVRTKGQRTVQNVVASFDGNLLRILPRTLKPSFGIDYDRLSVERFDEAGPQEFVYALLRALEKTKDRIEYVHPGPGQDFVLFFGVEGLKDFFIVANTFLWFNPRTGLCCLHRDDGTGTLKLGLRLDGQDAKGCTVMFEVAFRRWDSFSVTPVKLP